MNATVAYHLSTTQDGGIPLSAFPKDTTSELAGFVFTLSIKDSVKTKPASSLVVPLGKALNGIPSSCVVERW